MLFLPWRREEKLRGNYMSYKDRYNDEIEHIKATEKIFIHHEDEINNAFEHLQAAGAPQAAWDNIAPGAEEAEELAHQEGISDECPMAEEDIQQHINQIVNDRPQSHNESLNTKYTKEARKELLSPHEYNKCMRQLNTEQKTMAMYHRKWCKETVITLKQHKLVKPYHVFLSGSGGVGKSYAVKMLHTNTVKLLQCSQQIKPDDVPILLTAATGVAAHNINGITVHSALGAARKGRPDIVELLITAGAHLSCENEDYLFRTPLCEAVQAGSVQCIDLLLKAGADVNSDNILFQSKYAIVPFDLRRSPILIPRTLIGIRKVLQEGIKVNVKDDNGCNALTHFLTQLDGERREIMFGNQIEKFVMLLFAAGESVDETKVKTVPDHLKQSTEISLKNICRETIRKHLLQMSDVNLFVRVPLLPLPRLMTSYLLYDVTLEEEDSEDNNNSDSV